MRIRLVVAVAVAGLLTATPVHAAPMTTDPPNTGEPFVNYLVSNGFGYLDPQRVLSDGAVACVNDRHEVPTELIITMLTDRAYTEDEAKAVVAAERQAVPQLC